MIRERPAPSELAPHVACLWMGIAAGAPVLPDGCVDIVSAGGRLLVAGPATAAVAPSLQPGLPVFGVRFRIGAAGAALRLPAAELLDRSVDLADVWGRGGARLGDAVAEARPEDGLQLLVAAVARRLRDAPAVDPLARAGALAAARPGARVGEVARELAVSERHLLRRFREAVGYGPSTLMAVLRFQRFLALGAREPQEPLGRLAVDAGYADHAHLVRDCRRLAGTTPGRLMAARAGAAGEPALRAA